MTNRKEKCIIVDDPLNDAGNSLSILIFQALTYTKPGVPGYLMKRNFSPFNRITGSAITLTLISTNILAQAPPERRLIAQAGTEWWFYVVLIASLSIGLTIFLWRKLRPKPVTKGRRRESKYYSSNESYDMNGLDADQDLEWLNKAMKKKAKPASTSAAGSGTATRQRSTLARATAPADLDTKAFQEKMRKLQYSQLPINSFMELRPAKGYEPLPFSDDISLLNAIEQASNEDEEDEAVREIALKILAAFRSQNSVDSLGQIALYDLSSNLRSKAVSALTDFDHASVFEPILLACADPTREVRAAAARGLFRLNFDRADAWKRIMDSNDEFRMRHAAKAAIESGIVVKSFDRLIHDDMKVALEAFALTAFIICSGETEEIFTAIKNHKDERVKFALLHVLKVQKDERTISQIAEMKRGTTFSRDVAVRIEDTIASFAIVLA